MVIARLKQDEVVAAAVDALGFDPDAVDLETPEALAGAVRRAASFLCPVTPHGLVRSVEESLYGLVSVAQAGSGGSVVRDMVEDLVAYGDLVEIPIDDDHQWTARRFLFLAQPSYVPLSADTCVLLGVRADGLPLGDEFPHDRLRFYNHARHFELRRDEDPAEVLGGMGLRELSPGQWLNHPLTAPPSAVLEEYSTRLSAAGPAGSVEEVRILDPSTPVTYYRGRWRAATRRDSGRFVGRRPVQFGADLWCYCDLESGSVVRLIDLPAIDRLARGCDEAWRLQAAVDAEAGTPQILRVRKGATADHVILAFQSPIPSWGQRRLDALGQKLGHLKGSLFAYRLAESLVDAELEFLGQVMWLRVEREGEDR